MKILKLWKSENYFAAAITWIMTTCLAIWPFAMVTVKNFSTLKNAAGNEKVIFLILLGSFFACCIGIYNLCCSSEKKSRIYTYVVVFCISFVVRLFVSQILQVTPISDFQRCYEYAAGTGAGYAMAYYPYLGMYSLTLRAWFQLTTVSVFSAQVLNALVTSFIPIIIGEIIFRLTGKNNIAIIGAFAYAVFPGVVLYCAIPSCEHFSQFFLILTIYLFIRVKEAENKKAQYLYCVLTGISLGMMYMYKELFIIVAPAILMANFCYELIPEIKEAIKTKQKDFKNIGETIARSVIIVLIAAICHSVLVYGVQTTIHGSTLERNNDFSATFYEGLCKDGRGVWNPDVKAFVAEVFRTADSKKEVREIFFNALKEDYQDDMGALWELTLRKFNLSWCSENYYQWLSPNDTEHTLMGTEMSKTLFQRYPAIYWMAICAVIALGLILKLFDKTAVKEKHIWFIMIGCIFLFAIVCLILESQFRYKSSFMPIICVLFGMCFESIADFCKKLAEKIPRIQVKVIVDNKSE